MLHHAYSVLGDVHITYMYMYIPSVPKDGRGQNKTEGPTEVCWEHPLLLYHCDHRHQ